MYAFFTACDLDMISMFRDPRMVLTVRRASKPFLGHFGAFVGLALEISGEDADWFSAASFRGACEDAHSFYRVQIRDDLDV